MSSPLISVILATYNGSRYLTDAIESVLAQEYDHLELIIVDDASTDIGVSLIIQKYKREDLRVRSFRNEQNMERSWSKNRGVEMAKGDYIAFIDDDDLWEKSKLSKQMRALQNSENIGIVGSFARLIDESGNNLGETHHLKTESQEVKKNILITNQFIHSSVLIRKSIFLEVGGFPVDMNLCEDYDLWLRILSISEGANIPESLVKYRVRSSSTTAKNIYRMKYYSLTLTWKYRSQFSGFYRALLMRIILFPFNTLFLIRTWRRLFAQ